MIVEILKKIQKIKKFLMEAGLPIFFTPTVCKFHPSCSDYLIEAVEKQGLVRGGFKGLWRIFRCNPFSQGGFDPL